MKGVPLALAATAAPSIGPSHITVAGIEIPIAAMVMATLGLLLARSIAPAPIRKLTPWQERALTGLLLLFLFSIVTGQFTGMELGPNLSLMCGVGLGFTGLATIEFCGERTLAIMRTAFGLPPAAPPGEGVTEPAKDDTAAP